MNGYPVIDAAPDADLNVEAATFKLCSLLYRDPLRWAELKVGAAHLPAGPYAAVFSVLADLNARGVKAELIVLRAELEKQAVFLGEELDYLPASGAPENFEEYQRLILRDWDRRRLESLSLRLSDNLARGEIEEARADIDRSLAVSMPDESASLNKVLRRVFEEMEQPAPAYATGLQPLDYKLDGGVRPGEVLVIAARPGVGKSALALQMILHMATEGVGCALWSLEMSREQWARRAIAATALVSMKGLRTGGLSDADQIEVATHMGSLYKLPIRFAAGYDTTPAGFRLEAARQVRHHEAKVLVIDYLQLMQPDRRAQSREQEVARMCRELKRAALELEVPVIALAQLNREADNRVPTLANLRESGAVEQDADEVFFLHRERDDSTQKLTADTLGVVAKNRDGDTGAFNLHYDGEHYRFYPTQTERSEQPERRSYWGERDND